MSDDKGGKPADDQGKVTDSKGTYDPGTGKGPGKGEPEKK
jgi:hypothetical protein